MTPALGLFAALAAALAAMPAAPQAPARGPAVAWLGRTFGLSTDEVSDVAAGRSVARSLHAADDREIATVGIARIRVPAAWFAGAVADIARFKQSPQVPLVGVFGNPPQAADLARLSFEAGELRALRQCRPGRCDLQLPADLLEALARAAREGGGDAGSRAPQIVREGLASYAARYRASGAQAAMIYANTAEPVDTAAEFAALAGSDTRVLPQFTALREHLLRYPAPPALPVRDLIYWSREKVGRASVVTMTHVAMAKVDVEGGEGFVMASKQIYGSRYFDASLGLAVVLPTEAGGAPASYVAYLNRSRVDAFGGVFGAITRRAVRMRAVSGTADHLQRITRRLEAEFAVSQ